VRTAAGQGLCFACDDARRPWAFDLSQVAGGFWSTAKLVGHALDFFPRGDEIVAVMLATDGAKPAAMAVWDAFSDADPVFDTDARQPVLVEGPIQVGKDGARRFFFAGGKDGEAFVIPIGLIQYLKAAKVGQAVVFDDALVPWATATEPLVDLTPNG